MLTDLVRVLSPARLHFGWRVVDDVLDFVAKSSSDGVLGEREALDWIVYAKVLPKLRGHDEAAVRDAFASCAEVLKRHELRRSSAKLAELALDLQTTGNARFWR